MPANLQRMLGLLQGEATSEEAYQYFTEALGWYGDGVVLSEADCVATAQVWKRCPETRWVLNRLVLWYSCPEFKRPFYREAQAGVVCDYQRWLDMFPDLRGGLWQAALDRSRRFDQPFTAIDACLVLTRYFNGGDSAWRQIACVIKRDDRRDAKRPITSGLRGYVRHDLETHGTLDRSEANEINRFLLELGADPLQHWR